MSSKKLPHSILTLIRKTELYKKRAIRNKMIVPEGELDTYLNEAPPLRLEAALERVPLVGIVRAEEVYAVDGYNNPKASWLRYERFCKTNNIPYGFYDITKKDWIQEAKKYDVIVCHPRSNPASMYMMESKTYVLEKMLGISCFPSYHELWQYEDKNRANFLYACLDIPMIPTYVTFNKAEAKKLIEEISYPFITKTNIGAGSTGVCKVNTKQEATKIVADIFSHKGRKTQYPYDRQKNYFYVQEFIEDATFDLRVMLIGDMAFGYYRYPRKNDYRASGMGIVEKKAIPEDALKLAVAVRDKLECRQLGVDMLYSEKRGGYYIIETSVFNQIDTPRQLEVDGVAGYYDVTDTDNIYFKKGEFWVQELLLRDVITEWCVANKKNN